MFFKELETDRLYLKNLTWDDTAFIFAQFSNDQVNRYLFDAEPLTDLQGAEEIIQMFVEPEPRPHHRWVLIRKADGAKLGTCGFHCWDPGAALLRGRVRPFPRALGQGLYGRGHESHP